MVTFKARSIALNLCIGCLAAAITLPSGQTLGSQGPPALRVSIRLVVLNVVVHDKKGAPVRDLTRDDFKIFDGGQKEKISVFSLESSGTGQRPAQPLPPNVFSNRISSLGSLPSNVAAIVLDSLLTGLADQARLRQQLIRLLGQIQPADRIALYVLGSKLSVIQDFTDDPAPLLEAIRREKGRALPVSAADSNERTLASALPKLSGPGAVASTWLDTGFFTFFRDAAPRLEPASGAEHVLRLELAAFTTIADRLSGIPGRKSYIWLTAGLPALDFPYLFGNTAEISRFSMAHPGVSEEILETALALKLADVAVYPIDVRGLVVDPAYDAGLSQASLPVQGLDALNDTILGMNYVALQTGGRAFSNTNDLMGALRNALDDSEVTYTLGYYPTHTQWDGRYRPIKVEVDRKGVEVRHRQGYFARSEPVVEEKDRLALLRDAALSPLDATSVGLTVRLRQIKSAAGEQLEITLAVDASSLTFQPQKGFWTVSFDVWAGQFTNQSDCVGGVSKTVSADLKQEDYQKILREGGINLNFGETVDRGAEELRVVVRDVSSGSVGSLHVPLHEVAPQAPQPSNRPIRQP